MTVLEELGAAIGRVAGEVAPAVVGLGRRHGRGSGVVVGADRVLTNAHNLRSEEVTVTFADGHVETGRVLAADLDGDVSVLDVPTGDAPGLAWANGDGAAVGSPVFALANPGGRGLRVTLGFVAATGRSFRGPRGRRVGASLEHTAPLPRGSSGGPLVDESGRLVGVNTLRLEGGLILALAADASFRERVEALARGEAPDRVRLGIAVAPPRAARRLRRSVGLPERDGLLVHAVEEGTPAARAGLEQGDLIVAVDDAPVRRVDDLFQALDATAGDGALRLTVVRGVDERGVSVPLGGADR